MFSPTYTKRQVTPCTEHFHFQGMRFKEENHMNQLTKMKINFVKESSGISCLCKAINEWEPQFWSRSHLHSLLEVNPREKTALTERKNNQHLELGDGTTMVMRKNQKLQEYLTLLRNICMKLFGNLSKSWKRLIFHGNLGMQRWRSCACTNSGEFCFKLRNLRKPEALETWDCFLGFWHLSKGRQEMHSWGKDPTKSSNTEAIVYMHNRGVVVTATNLPWETWIKQPAILQHMKIRN